MSASDCPYCGQALSFHKLGCPQYGQTLYAGGHRAARTSGDYRRGKKVKEVHLRSPRVKKSLEHTPKGTGEARLPFLCPVCGHRWEEVLSLPMEMTAYLARIGASTICPECGNNSKARDKAVVIGREAPHA